MKYYVTSDCMYSTNVAFNIKTGENILIFCRFLSFEKFVELTFSFFIFQFFTMHNCTRDTHKDRLRGSDGTEA